MDSRGRPIQWVPFAKDDDTGVTYSCPKNIIPCAVDRYEVNFDVLPLPTTTTTTSTTTPPSLPSTPGEHLALLHSDPESLSPLVKAQFTPKLLRQGSTIRLYHWRYDEQQKKFCWHAFAQPIRPPATTQVNPELRISCPSLAKKYDYEAIIDFSRYYTIRPDGTYYQATPERIYDGSGYGPYGSLSPTVAGTCEFVDTTI